MPQVLADREVGPTGFLEAIPESRIVAMNRSADFHVCCIAGFQTCEPFVVARPADLEIGDTAGLETCATYRGSWIDHD